MTVIFFVFNCWSLTELVVSLFLLNFYQPIQCSCSYALKPNHLYSRNGNRGSISSWRRLFNRNENLRLSLTRYLAIASLRERLKQCVYLISKCTRQKYSRARRLLVYFPNSIKRGKIQAASHSCSANFYLLRFLSDFDRLNWCVRRNAISPVSGFFSSNRVT